MLCMPSIAKNVAEIDLVLQEKCVSIPAGEYDINFYLARVSMVSVRKG